MLLRFCNLVSVLFKLTLISVNKVSGENLFPNRFVNRVIMHTWIVNKELLLLFDFRVWSWNRRQQSLGVRMQRMTEKLFCLRQLDDLTFVADDDANGAIVTLDFTAYGDTEKVSGVLKILIGDVDTSSSDKGDIQYTVLPGKEVEFDRYDFYDFCREEYSGTPRYVTFKPDSSLKSSNGILYYDYDGRDEVDFSRTKLANTVFYYSDSDYGD